MSKYTMYVRDAVNSLGGSVEIVDGIFKINGDIGLSNYPIFDEAYRETLNSNILRFYWLYEIGVETPELWKHNIETDMFINMPYFNELYKTTKLDIDPLSTIDIRTLATGENQSAATSETQNSSHSEAESSSRDVASNFPQTMLNGSGDYASSGADGTATTSSDVDGTTNVSGNETGNTKNESTTKGYQGRAGDILTSYRSALLNVDRSVIISLEDNFMQIRDSGNRFADRYTFERYTS